MLFYCSTSLLLYQLDPRNQIRLSTSFCTESLHSWPSYRSQFTHFFPPMACSSYFPPKQNPTQYLCGIGASFINNNSSVRISFQTLCLPRSAGGLAVLHPLIQILKLQWRWLAPMLLNFQSTPFNTSALFPHTKPSIPYSVYMLHQYSIVTIPATSTPSHLWPLLFPSCRPYQLTSNIFNPFQAMFDTVDNLLCRSYDDIHLNLVTTLQLPLSEILHPCLDLTIRPPLLPQYHPQPKYYSSPIFKKLIASDIFTYDSSTNKLRYKYFNRTEITTHSGTCKRVLLMIFPDQLFECAPSLSPTFIVLWILLPTMPLCWISRLLYFLFSRPPLPQL